MEIFQRTSNRLIHRVLEREKKEKQSMTSFENNFCVLLWWCQNTNSFWKMDLESYRVQELPNSVYYIPDIVSLAEEDLLLNKISKTPRTKWTQLRNRRLQNWGGMPHQKGMIPEEIPDWLEVTLILRSIYCILTWNGATCICITNLDKFNLQSTEISVLGLRGHSNNKWHFFALL